MAIFTSHVSGSSGLTSLTGSLRIMSPHGTPQDMILTASHASFGPAIGIGTSVAPNTTFAINDDLGLTDNASNSRLSIANTNAYVNVGTDTNNRGFMLWENGSTRLRFGTKQSGNSFFNTLHLKSGQVGIGDDADTGVDLHVKGGNKAALIGDNATPPGSDSKLYLGNTDTFIGHTTFGGGFMVLQSTASIAIVNDRTIGAGTTSVSMLMARNDVQDVRIEAPAGVNVDNNLNVTGSIFIKSNGTSDTRFHVSGSGDHAVSIAPQGTNNLQIDRGNTNARLALRRIDSSILALNELGTIKIVGSEDDGVTELGGSVIKSIAQQSFSSTKGGSDLSFLNTVSDTITPAPAFTISGSAANRVTFDNDIRIMGNRIRGSGGGSTITMDGSDNVTIGGNLTVDGGQIIDETGATAINLAGNGKVELSNTYSGITAAGLSVDNKNTALNSGGFVEVSKTINGIVSGETLGGILFAGADTTVSSTPNPSAKILAKTVENWTHNVAQGTEIQFHTTNAGATSAIQTAQISRSGITGSVGGLKLEGGNIQLPNIPMLNRAGQDVRPGIFLSDYSSDDVSVYRVDASDAGHGYTLVYSGSGSALNNKLELWADNTATGANSQQQVYSVMNDGKMTINSLVAPGILGTDPVGSDANPDVVIAGRRWHFNAFCVLTKADAATNGVKKIVPLNALGTGEQTFANYDQQPEQNRFAFVAPSDGYIESIQVHMDHMWGDPINSGDLHTIEFYRMTKNTNLNLSFVSPIVTKEFHYGYRSAANSANMAGKVLHLDVADATRTNSQFSAGDKIYMSFQGHNSDSRYRDASGASSSTSVYVNINVNFVFDDRNLDT